GIRHGFEVLSRHMGEGALFCGDVAAQIGPDDVHMPGMIAVHDLETAEAAIETIIDQGEGAPGHSEDSHYNRFLRVRREYDEFIATDPAFEPAFPVAHNPVMRAPRDAAPRVVLEDPTAAKVLDLANAVYGHALRCLVQSYGRRPDDQANKRLYVDAAIDLMFVLTEIGPYLASLPAGKSHPGINAGVTFTTLRDLARLPSGPAETRIIAERFAEMAHHARSVCPLGHELAHIAEAIDKIGAKFGPAVATVTTQVAKAATAPAVQPVPLDPSAPPVMPKPDDLPSGAGAAKIELVEGKDLTIRYEGKRCIHARFCVLNAPKVFRANTPGTWIYPDAMPTEDVLQVAHDCPSGAIRYTRKDGGAEEHAPPVNTVNVRENGPYAFRAQLKIGDLDVGFRATLCRCGQSKRKPFCDGSHNAVGFAATGEPGTRKSEPLQVRDGELVVDPQRNGPLQVSGNLEVLSGTGRTVDRVTRVRMCRCGNSRSKPFCDGSHARVGFEADGS
ncbi:MAG TPA: CDGSH iron-sulfur domain-containing protein, partial [Xanthobacteraceae bacterium]|nr:CDGSH iron-sulfur domain-containing protein [Xanthobacteraceae bacterium]